jgi:hypothetical protein
MAITHSSSAFERHNSVQGDYASDFRAASLAARLADSCVSADFLPNVWQTYYELFQDVLSTEMGGVL